MAQETDSNAGTPEAETTNTQPADTTTSTVEVLDDDARLLKEAQDAAAAERAAKTGTTTEETPAAEAGAATAPEGQAAEGEPEPQPGAERPVGGAQPQMVPLARLNEVLGKVRDAELLAARLQGQVDALSKTAPANGTGTPKQPTPEERLDQIDTELATLNGKFFRGEIDETEFQKQQTTLRREERQLVLRSVASVTSAAAPAGQTGQTREDLYLDDLTAQLEDQHPYSKHIKSDEDWRYIERRARAELRREGVAITDDDRRSVYQLRTRMAELATKLGPTLVGPLPTGAAKPGTTTTSARTPAAQARESKLGLAAAHPVDIRAAGAGGDNGDAVTKERVALMTDDEIAALPAATRRRLFPTVSTA